MSFAQRVLYHQVHPAKLFADIATALIGIDLFWHHEVLAGLIIVVVTPALVSTVLLLDGDFETLRRSRLGAYVRRFMPPWLLAVRLFGVGVAFYAAWYHVPAGVIGGLVLVVVCWGNGIVPRRGSQSHGFLDSLRASRHTTGLN